MKTGSWRLGAGASLVAVALSVCGGGGCEQMATSARTDNTWYDESDPYLTERRAEQNAAQPDREQPLATTRDRAPEVRVEERRSQGRGTSYRPHAGGNMMVASLAFPTGDESTSALLVQEVLPREVRPGQPFDYEIHVTNLTSGTLSNVLIETQGMDNMSIAGSTPQGQSINGGGTRWAIGELGPQETEIIKVNAKAEEQGQATNCITASYANSLCARTSVVQPSVALVRAVPTEVLGCEPIAIRYEVKNTGSGTADGIRVRDQLPSGLTTTDGKNTVDFDAGALGPGQSRVYTVNVKAAKPGRYEAGAARVEGGAGLSAQAEPMTITVRQPVLEIEADCGQENVLIGRNATFRFIVKNTGDAPANNTVVRAAVPSGSQLVSADAGGGPSSGGASWNLGTIAAGESKTITAQIRPSGAGTFRTSVRATAHCAQEATASCEATVQGVPDIGSGLTDDDGVVVVGDSHVYRLELQNQGQVNLTNAKLVFTMPEGLSFVSAQGIGPPTVSGNTATFNLGSLRPREKKAWTVTVKSSKAGEFKVSTDVTADEIKNAMHRDEITVFVDR